MFSIAGSVRYVFFLSNRRPGNVAKEIRCLKHVGTPVFIS